MTGFDAYRLYMAVKLHFTTEYDIFAHNAKVRGKFSTFEERNDKLLFEKLATKYNKHLLQFFVANFAYGNDSVIYSVESDDLYNTWISRKESITQCFHNDLCKIEDLLTEDGKYKDNLYDGDIPLLFKYYMGGKVTFETMEILESYVGFLDNWTSNISIWKNHFLVLQKGKRFVKYNKDRTDPVYAKFLSGSL